MKLPKALKFKKKVSTVHFKEYYGAALCGKEKPEMEMSPFYDDMVETMEQFKDKFVDCVPCERCIERHPLWQLENANLEEPDNDLDKAIDATAVPSSGWNSPR